MSGNNPITGPDGFLPARECQIISQIIRAVKTLPDDFWGVASVQELAGFIARNEARLSEEDCAILIGLGAILSVQAKAEMTAEIEMRMAIGRAQERRK
jgi:hypothetical protein